MGVRLLVRGMLVSVGVEYFVRSVYVGDGMCQCAVLYS